MRIEVEIDNQIIIGLRITIHLFLEKCWLANFDLNNEMVF